jgi:tetraacyldisaccharide 4'-kinase
MRLAPRGVRAVLARALESNGASFFGAAILSSAYGAIGRRTVCRPLDFPASVRVIGVGGSTLGGSGKTPIAIAIARALAERGERVVLVGHAYRARPGFDRVVSTSDHVREVGDEALLAARALAPIGVEVIVSTTRREAVSFASRRARWLVLDGMLQSRPHRLTRAVLALDARAPWGSERFPPSGDLRAPRDALLDAADLVALVRDERDTEPIPIESHGKRVFEILTHADRVTDRGGRSVPLTEIAPTRLGLLVAVARPQRIEACLARRGIRPAVTLALADHERPTEFDIDRALSAAPQVDAWVTTAKCATKLPDAIRGAPVWALDYRVELSDSLISAVVNE